MLHTLARRALRASRRAVVAAVAAGTLAALPAALTAQPPMGGPPGGQPGGMMGGPRGGGMQAMLFEGITLTDAQRVQVDSIQQAARGRMRERMAAQGDVPPDSAARAAMRQERMRATEQDYAAMRALLTADQQKTFDANVARVQEAQRARMQRGPGGRGR